MTRLAQLAMYDLPELRQATDAWWGGLAGSFRATGIESVPDGLTRELDCLDVWRSPQLFLSQTCGYPLMTELAGQVSIVASPVYDCPEVQGANYCSLILVRANDPAIAPEDLRNRRAVVNGRNSQSGYAALRAVFAPLARDGRFFSNVLVSGAHMRSLEMVVAGEADVCACDNVTYHLLERYKASAVEGLRLLGRSPIAPSLPYVTAGDAEESLIEALRQGILAASADPRLAEAREKLLISGFEIRPLADYDRIVEMEADCIASGYPEVA